MKLCQFYASAERRKQDLERRVPVEARLGVLIDGKVVDITDHAKKHHDINTPERAGVLAACVAAGEEWAGLREEIAGLSGDGGVAPESVFFGPCVLRASQYLDFYAFEQHVMTMRKQRGLDFIVPEWYEIPAYYNSNATSMIGHGMTAYFPAGEEKMDFECEISGQVLTAANEAGILLKAPRPNTVRFMPPLTITKGEIDQGLERLGNALATI